MAEGYKSVLCIDVEVSESVCLSVCLLATCMIMVPEYFALYIHVYVCFGLTTKGPSFHRIPHIHVHAVAPPRAPTHAFDRSQRQLSRASHCK